MIKDPTCEEDVAGLVLKNWYSKIWATSPLRGPQGPWSPCSRFSHFHTFQTNHSVVLLTARLRWNREFTVNQSVSSAVRRGGWWLSLTRTVWSWGGAFRRALLLIDQGASRRKVAHKRRFWILWLRQIRGFVEGDQTDRVERCANWRSRGRARWHRGSERRRRLRRSGSGWHDAERRRFRAKRRFFHWCGAEKHPSTCLQGCCTFGALGRPTLPEGWCNRFAQKRCKKCEQFTFETWVLVDGQLSRKLCGCHIAPNSRFPPRRQSVAWRAARINRCRVATASLRPRPLYSRFPHRGVPQHLPGCSTGPPVVHHFTASVLSQLRKGCMPLFDTVRSQRDG